MRGTVLTACRCLVKISNAYEICNLGPKAIQDQNFSSLATAEVFPHRINT